MTNSKIRWIQLVVCLALAVWTAGCIGIQRNEVYEYILHWPDERPATFDPDAPSEPRGSTLAIGPIVLPSYLHRPAIVTIRDASAESRIHASGLHTWGEPLEAGVGRLLVEVLVLETNSNRISQLPWPFPGQPERRVAVEILGFELDFEQKIHMVARWTVLDARGIALLVRRVILEEPVDDTDDYPQIVDAMSRAVLALGREIAVDIKSLPSAEAN